MGFASLLAAQAPGVLTIGSIPLTGAKRGEVVTIEATAQLRNGYHVNSNTPSESYLIPLKLTWDANLPVETVEVVYPKPKLEKYAFAEKPLSVFSGDFKIVTKMRAKASAPMGPAQITGKLRYQACTDKECLPPKTVPVSFTMNVK